MSFEVKVFGNMINSYAFKSGSVYGEGTSREINKIPVIGNDHHTSFSDNVIDVSLPEFPINSGDKLKLRVLDKGYSFLALEAYHEHPWNIEITKITPDNQRYREHKFVVKVDSWKVILRSDAEGYDDDYIDVTFNVIEHTVNYCEKEVLVDGMDVEDTELELKEYDSVEDE